MSDPSDRYAEIHPCGCEWHAGQWFPCERHRELYALVGGSPTRLEAFRDWYYSTAYNRGHRPRRIRDPEHS